MDEESYSVTAIGHAATIYTVDASEGSDWEQALAQRLAPDTPESAIEPLLAVFALARRHNVRALVLEEFYLDPDYRSEYAAFWSKRFERRDRVAKRIHFFSTEVSPDELTDLSEPSRAAYIGYCVLRPTVLGPVGRCVLKPPVEWVNAILCTTRDRPSLFGNELEVEGVPFSQQDGELLICAHTAAWLCHYLAHNKGIIGRRATAEIVSLPSVESSRHRPFPSPGLTSEQLQGVFSALGIPAFFYDVDDLPDLPWEPEPLPPAASKEDHDERARAIRREEIRRVVCKYLNSGFPVVVLSQGRPAHAFTLVGWRQDGETDVLIGCDDQVGPYEEIYDPLSADHQHRGEWTSFMVPLPEKVFLTGEAAQTAAIGYLEVTAAHAHQSDAGAEVAEISAGDTEILALAEKLAVGPKGPLSVRTRLMEGRQYKSLLARQGRPRAVCDLLRLASLPHWVWVVEFQDRAARGDRHDGEPLPPCVCAEVVLDSTSHDDVPVIDLIATTTVAADAAVARTDPENPAAQVEGDGRMWRSMISDPEVEPRLVAAPDTLANDERAA